MSQIDRNGPAFTLRQFEELASRSRDDQNLRIRQNGRELSNTSLGPIAYIRRNAESNYLANTAFIKAVVADKRYADAAAHIHRMLSARMRTDVPLTPARVRAALNAADNVFALHREGNNAACALADFKLLPGSMINEFTSFFMDYKAKHRDVKLDLRDLGDAEALPEDKRGLTGFPLKVALQEADAKRLAPLGAMLTEFFSKGDRLERSGFFAFQPQDCGNDASKARALGSLVTKNASNFASLKTEQDKAKLLENVFEIDSKKLLEKGSVFSAWEDGFHRAFMDKARQVKPNENFFQYCSVDDLSYLEQHAPAGASPSERTEWLFQIYKGLDRFCRVHPGCMQPGGEEEVSAAVRYICDAAARAATAPGGFEGKQAAHEWSLLRQVEKGACDGIFSGLGISRDIGRAALNSPEFLRQGRKALAAPGSNLNEAGVAEIVREEARKFVAANADALQKFSDAAAGMDADGARRLVHLGLPMANLIQTMQRGGGDVTLLRQANIAADRYDEAGDGREATLSAVLDALLGGSSSEDVAGLCQNNKGSLDGLLGQLAAVAGDDKTAPAIRQNCAATASLLNFLHLQILDRLPADRQAGLQLSPKKAEARDPRLAMQMDRPDKGAKDTVRPVRRDADPAEMFAAIRSLEESESSSARRVIPLVEKCRCTDTALLNSLYGLSGGCVEVMMESLYKSCDYADSLTHYYKDILSLGQNVQSYKDRFPQYSSDDIAKLHADMFVASHSDEELARLLDNLHSPESLLALSVLWNHAKKEEAALKGKPSKQLDAVHSAFDSLSKMSDAIAARLGRPRPESLTASLDPGRTIHDLPRHKHLNEVLPNCFRAHLSDFDTKMFMVRDRLGAGEYERLKSFTGGLRLPDGKTVREKSESKTVTVAYDVNGEQEEAELEISSLNILVTFHAKELSDLLERSGGSPAAGDVWQVLHGGRPPLDLTMDNLAEKLLQRTAQEIATLGRMVNSSLDPNAYIQLCEASFGIPPSRLLQCFSKAATEDVTITFRDQQRLNGFFSLGSGKEYENGKEAYGFGVDYFRAKMPPGAKNESDEGCKITVAGNGREQAFTQNACQQVTNDLEAQGNLVSGGSINHPYTRSLVETVRALCKSDAQLAGVGHCTTQALLMGLRNAGSIYKDVSGGALEHTALDYRIEALDDGKVKVTVREKPGSLFGFNMVIIADENGDLRMEDGSITYPSLQKWEAHRQAHPEDMLR